MEELKAYLYKYLPQYMVPNYFKKIMEWPLTPNKKIDKQLLSQWHCGSKLKKHIAPRDSKEKEIEKIWKRVLKQSKISIDEEFIDVGGDSLQATLLSNMLLEQFQIQIPLTEIFTCTISEMAKLIKENPQEQQIIKDENLILLKRGNDSQKNLFLIHAGNGEAEVFIDICDNISIDVNIWGIRADRQMDYSPRNVSLEKIAESYVKKIIKVQSNGKISLMGWCIGGSIAFEMALQLEAKGREIGFFGMINSFAPDIKFWGEVPEFTISSEVRKISRYPRFADFKDKITNVQSIEEIWHKSIKFYQEIGLTANEMKGYVYDDMDRAIPNFEADNITAFDIIYYINVLRTFDNVRALYVPENKLRTQCYFFRATNEQAANISLWNQYCEKKIEVLDVEGDNFTVLRYPGVLHFANLLNDLLLREEVYS